MVRLDVQFGEEVRPRALTIQGPGARFYDGGKLLFSCGAKDMVRALLTLAKDSGGGEWAVRLLPGALK